MSKLEAPEYWATGTLSDVATVQNGYAFKSALFSTKDGTPLIRIRDISRGYSETFYRGAFDQEYLVHSGDILVGMDGNFECHVWTGKPSLLNQRVCRIIPKGDFPKGFLVDWLNTQLPLIQAKTVKVTVGHLSSKQLLQLPLPIPPLGEQKRIVAKIESTQEKIKTIEQSVTNAEDLIGKYREALLRKAFRGELVPQDPNDEPASKLLERIRADRTKQTEGKKKKKDELPPIKPEEIPFEIPKSWEWIRWGNLVSEDSGFKRGPFGSAITKAIFVKSSPYKIYEQYCPINDDCSYARYFITEKKFQEMESFAVKARDLLISCSGVTLGRITEVPDEHDKGIINQAILRIRLDNRLILNNYFINFFRTQYFQKKLFEFAPGSAQPNMVGVAILKELLIPVPPLPEQDRLIRFLSLNRDIDRRFVTAIDDVQRQIELLSKSVLNFAFSGRLVPQVASEGNGYELLEKLNTQGLNFDDAKKTRKKRAKA